MCYSSAVRWKIKESERTDGREPLSHHQSAFSFHMYAPQQGWREGPPRSLLCLPAARWWVMYAQPENTRSNFPLPAQPPPPPCSFFFSFNFFSYTFQYLHHILGEGRRRLSLVYSTLKADGGWQHTVNGEENGQGFSGGDHILSCALVTPLIRRGELGENQVSTLVHSDPVWRETKSIYFIGPDKTNNAMNSMNGLYKSAAPHYRI